MSVIIYIYIIYIYIQIYREMPLSDDCPILGEIANIYAVIVYIIYIALYAFLFENVRKYKCINERMRKDSFPDYFQPMPVFMEIYLKLTSNIGGFSAR